MFKFLKEKIKDTVGKFSKQVEEEGKEETKTLAEVEKDTKSYEIKDSSISGDGTFAAKEIIKGEKLGLAFTKLSDSGVPDKDYERTELGAKTNHSEKPNVKLISSGKEFYFKSIKKINQGEELFIDYSKFPWEGKRDFVKSKIIEKFKKEEKPKEVKTLEQIEQKEKKSILGKVVEKVVTKKINEEQFEKMFWELELMLLENNVAVEVIEKIKSDLKMDLVNTPIKRGDVLGTVQKSLKDSVEELFDVDTFDFIEKAGSKKPFIIAFVGVNGSGKTTTIAKVIKLLKENKLSCVVAAADTFRSAAIEQLEEHTNNLGVKLIKHEYKSDPAAVCFDAIEHAKAKNKDVVLIDTAGRLHSNLDLMNEMKKIVKVANPDLKIFVGESITGNDCIEQVKQFNDAVGVDGIILSKADVDEKGGASISVSYVTKKPILYIGVGQEYKDLEKFEKSKIIETLEL